MEFTKEANGVFRLYVDGMALIMTREDAEDLFVQIGHVLQDDDLSREGCDSEEYH